MIIIFPENCITDASRMAWCYRAQEKLRLVHNGFGKWFRDGLTENQYNQFPNKIKNRYPYEFQVNESTWDDFQENIFDPLSQAITDELLIARGEAKESTFWNPDIDEDIN
jgi:hypothetical protein